MSIASDYYRMTAKEKRTLRHALTAEARKHRPDLKLHMIRSLVEATLAQLKQGVNA